MSTRNGWKRRMILGGMVLATVGALVVNGAGAEKQEEKDMTPDDGFTDVPAAKLLYSKADPAVRGRIPPELRHMDFETWPIMIRSDEYHLGDWQESPSKIIYHDGWYHIWVMDLPLANAEVRAKAGRSSVRYMKSKDMLHWQDQGLLPLGEPGMFDDKSRWADDVILHDGKFYMFYETATGNIEKYGQRRAGVGCLVADKPEGPWTYASREIILRHDAENPEAYDHELVTNPRMAFLNGKWFMYYKCRKDPSRPTDNAVATADNILGPYTKFEGNPICQGHSAFLLNYKHGLLYFNACPEEIYWTEDGFTFTKIGAYGRDERHDIRFVWTGFYDPCNPLCGGDAKQPPPAEYKGITSSWAGPFGYHKRNNDILGLTLRIGKRE